MILKYKTKKCLMNHVLYQIAHISIMSCVYTLVKYTVKLYFWNWERKKEGRKDF